MTKVITFAHEVGSQRAIETFCNSKSYKTVLKIDPKYLLGIEQEKLLYNLKNLIKKKSLIFLFWV